MNNAYQQVITKHAALSALVANLALENRAPSDDEKQQLATLKSEIEQIKAEADSAGKKLFADNFATKQVGEVAMLKKGESLEKHVSPFYPDEYKHLSLAKILKGVVFGDWQGADLERKAQGEGTSAAGGVFIPVPVAARVVDLARAAAQVFNAGAQTIPMDTATLKVPRLTGDVSGSWTSEGTDITEVDASFDAVTFTARKLAVVCAIDNELLEDAPNCNAAIENSIAKAVALALDYAALEGSGTAPQPLGLFNNASVPTASLGAAPTNYTALSNLAQAVRGANFEPNALLWNAKTAGVYALLADTLGQPMRLPTSLSNLQWLVTNQIPSTGTSPVKASVVGGDWTQLAFGLRAGMRIEASREASYYTGSALASAFSKDQTVLRCVLRGDWQPLHPLAFAIASNITVG